MNLKTFFNSIITNSLKSEKFLIRFSSRLILIFLSLFLLLVIFDKIIMPMAVSSEIVEVPAVEGLKLEDAQKVLSKRNLRGKVVSQKFDDKIPANCIILQKPKPNARVKENRYIYLVVSGGENMASMPNLVGRSLKEAKFILERLNLQLVNIKEVESEEPVGFVIAQNYPEGSMLKKDAKIYLTISGGATHGKINLPDLIGKSYKDAEKILRGIGINNIVKTYQESRILLPNTVIEQYPAKNKLVSPRDTIKLIITIESSAQIEEGTD
jgi:serine/threonine-protein kinase